MLEPTENDNGQYTDSNGNPVNSFFVGELGRDTCGPYTLLYGKNSHFEFGTNFGFASFNILCEKPIIFIGK